MARFRLKPGTIRSANRGTQLTLRRFIRDSGVLEDVGQFYVDNIKERGIDPFTNRKYKALAPSTIERRKRLATVNSVDPNYSPRRSNITFTGETLDSLRARIFIGRGEIDIGLRGTHSRYRGIRKARIGRRISNARIGEFLEEGGRHITTISRQTQSAIVERMRRGLRFFLRQLS